MYILNSDRILQLNAARWTSSFILTTVGLLHIICDFWELAPLWVCADHTPNTLVNALRLRNIGRCKHRKTGKSGKPCGDCVQTPGKQSEQM